MLIDTKNSYKILQKFYKAFEYPFSFINMDKNDIDYIDTYEVKNIAHIMFNKNMKIEKINLDKFNFPNNIIDVYWYEEGENDIKPKKIKKIYFFLFFALKNIFNIFYRGNL
jgi:hypothetical protein